MSFNSKAILYLSGKANSNRATTSSHIIEPQRLDRLKSVFSFPFVASLIQISLNP